MARGWKAVPQRVPDQETLAPATQQAVSAPSETRRAFAQMLGGIAFLLATTPVAAQSGALVFQLGGAFMPKFDVSDTRDEIGGGIAATGGIVAQLGPNFAIRGAALSLVTSLTGDSVSVSDRGVRRTFLMGDLIFGIPTPIGARPYFFGGSRTGHARSGVHWVMRSVPQRPLSHMWTRFVAPHHSRASCRTWNQRGKSCRLCGDTVTFAQVSGVPYSPSSMVETAWRSSQPGAGSPFASKCRHWLFPDWRS